MFDVAVCCFGIMFMPDKAAAYREARRVLRPAGRFILAVWDRIEANPLMHVAEETLAGLFPGRSAALLLAHALRLQRQGPDRARAARGRLRRRPDRGGRRATADVPAARQPAIGCCQGTPLRDEIEARDPGGLARATDAVAAALRARFGDGPFRAPQQALLATAA